MLSRVVFRNGGRACQQAALHLERAVTGRGLATLAPFLPAVRSVTAGLKHDPLPAFDARQPNDRQNGHLSSSVVRQHYRFLTATPIANATADLDLPAHGADPTHPDVPAKHPGSPSKPSSTEEEGYLLMHPVYTADYVRSVTPKHKPPHKVHEYLAYGFIQSVRSTFDVVTGYGHNNMTAHKWMVRTIFLETVAGVPGMVAGMLRHMNSLRRMERDHGWIHTLLEEAENERMHLLTFLQLRQPGLVFRTMVLLGQGVFFNAYMLLYILAPKTCHSAVGYLEEEAVKTYTHLVQDLDAGKIPEWHEKEAPEIAKMYWRLEDGATIKDMILAIRADEACHSYVNHTLSELNRDDTNPFSKGSHQVP